MAINVEHGVDAGLVLEVASATGEAQLDREVSAQQAAERAQRRAQLDNLMLMRERNKLEAERDVHRSEIRVEEANARQEIALQGAEREHTLAQQMELRQLETKIARVNGRPDLSDEQRAHAVTQLEDQYARIQSDPRGGEKLTPQQQIERTMVKLPGGKVAVTLPDGKTHLLDADDAAGAPAVTRENVSRYVDRARRSLAPEDQNDPAKLAAATEAIMQAEQTVLQRARMTPEERAAADGAKRLPELQARRDELDRMQYALNPEDRGRAERVKAELAQVEQEIRQIQAAGAAPGQAPAQAQGGGTISVTDPVTGQTQTAQVPGPDGQPAPAPQPVEVEIGGQRVRPLEQPPPPAPRRGAQSPERATWMMMHVAGRQAPLTEEEFAKANPEASPKDFGDYRTEYVRWQSHGPAASLPRPAFRLLKNEESRAREEQKRLMDKHGERWRQTREGQALMKSFGEFMQSLAAKHPEYAAALQQVQQLRGHQ